MSKKQAAAHAGCETLSAFNDWIRRGIIWGWVFVSPTMERQNENYLAGAVRTERCNNAVWQRHMGESR
jgi:hypothetical protein